MAEAILFFNIYNRNLGYAKDFLQICIDIEIITPNK